MRIDFNQPPYDQATVRNVYDEGQCPGVGAHFDANPISVGDCVVIGGEAFRILAVQVVCEGDVVFERGDPSGPPHHEHHYGDPPVVVKLWLEPIPLEECP